MTIAVSDELVPSASRLASSLRDIGYDLTTAIADLVDNSIAAGASRVALDMKLDDPDPWIRIADNGHGMDPPALEEAMRFGSRRSYGARELGKFGLGLKAASLSQCRRLTVATRSELRGPIQVRAWDLDHIESTDRWEVLRPAPGERSVVEEPLRNGVGTVVLWDRLDRIGRRGHPDGRRSDNFARIRKELGEHLAMVFHRFLAAEARRGIPLEILVDGRPLRPWDPFVRDEAATVEMPAQRMRLAHEGGLHVVIVRPYLLPPEARFSSPEAHRNAAGPARWNRQQGFYIYRNDRVIQAGGWCRLRTSDEHTKLARIALDFPSSLDPLFELNISKTRVRLPSALRSELATITSAVARLAQNAYRIPGSAIVGGEDKPMPSDPRARAVAELTRMILGTVEATLVQELDRLPAARDRLLLRIAAMEDDFIRQLEKRTAGAPAQR